MGMHLVAGPCQRLRGIGRELFYEFRVCDGFASMLSEAMDASWGYV